MYRKMFILYVIVLFFSTSFSEKLQLPHVWVGAHTCDPEQKIDHPYITSDVFRAYANHLIDPVYSSFDPSIVKEGDTVYVYTFFLKFFFSTVHPKIRFPYILITNGGDHAIPGKYNNYLEDTKLIAWFGRNVMIRHDKMFACPLGITASRLLPTAGDIKSFEEVVSEKLPKKHLLHGGGFSIHNNSIARTPVFNYFKNKPFCYWPKRKPFTEYLRELAESKFVLSPNGNGADCYRTWEAIMVGTIPIVTSGPLNVLYKDLPVLIIDNWEEVTKEFLKNQYQKMKKQTYNCIRLYNSYWIEQIEKVKRNYWKNKKET